VDDLLASGYRNVDVLDLSETALDVARQRLGTSATSVGWLRGDVTSYPFEPSTYDLWHDRAVFHFLTDPSARSAYVRQVLHAVKPGGHVIVATFGPDRRSAVGSMSFATTPPRFTISSASGSSSLATN
jgi:SAM-dependent methyltransferase